MDKNTPHCKLSIVKQLVEADQVRTTRSAREGAAALGFDFDEMRAVVIALTTKDFFKSMTIYDDHKVWQDVYRPVTSAGPVYLVDRHRRCADRIVQGVISMKCPSCGAAKLVHETRDLPYVYKGQTLSLEHVTGDFCPACDEAVLDAAESRRTMALMKEFNVKVNSELADPAFILSVRKKLNLDQREAGEIFGGGTNAFSRYETGKTKPPVALVKLLKVLYHHPELLQEVRAA